MKKSSKVCRRFPMYEISSDGEFYNIRTKSLVRPIYSERKHDWTIPLVDKMGVKRQYRAAELIAETYHGLHDDGFDVEYIDGDSHHLHADNLRWIKQYNPDRLKVGHKTMYILVVETGELFDDIYECSKSLGSSVKSIRNCLNYPYLMNHSGYHLQYVER